MVRSVFAFLFLFLLAFPAFSQEWIIREYWQQSLGMPGPRGVVTEHFEYRAQGDRVYVRHSIGPPDEPYREVELPGTARRIAATADRLYVWVGESLLLEFRVGRDGPQEPGYLLPSDFPAALEALRRSEPPPPPGAVAAEAGAAVVINPARLLVANSGGGVSSAGISGDSVTAVDTATNQVIGTIALSAGDAPTDVAVAPDNSSAYTANFGCRTCSDRGVSILDPDGLRAVGRISAGPFPAVLVITSDGSRLYVAEGRNVRAFDTRNNNLAGLADVGVTVQDLALTANGKTLYVLASSPSRQLDRLFVINTATMTVASTYNLPDNSGCAIFALSPDERRLYVSCVTNPRLLLLDASSGQTINTILTAATLGLTFSPNGKKLYATHAESATVEVLDPSTGTRLKQMATGNFPAGIVVNKTGTRGYVANVGGNSVTVLDLVNESPIANVRVGPEPFAVALTTPPPEFSATPLQLTFNAGANQTNPPPQNVALSVNQAGAFTWTAAVSTQSGGNWLSVSPTSGTFPTTVEVSAKIAGLTIGNYSGTVTITVPNTVNSPQNISVSLRVTPTGMLVLSASEVTFPSVVTAPPPAPKVVQITNNGVGSLTWRAVVTAGAGPWLNLNPASGTTPGTLTVGVNPQGFPAGRLEATVSLSSPEATNSPQSFRVVYTLLPGPSVPLGAVVNAASFAQGAAVTPGSLVSIFGTNFGPASALGATTLPLPIVLGDVKVIMGGFAAPLIFVSGTQINCQVPFELTGQTNVSLVVQSGAASSAAVNVLLAPAAPGIFTVALGGRTQGAILNKDNTLNTPSNPARAGEIVQIFATGQGAVTNTPPSGAPAASSPLSSTPTTPTVLIGGRQGEVVFSGLTPGLVGLWQINAVVPVGMPLGDSVPVQIVHGGTISNSALMAVVPPESP